MSGRKRRRLARLTRPAILAGLAAALNGCAGSHSPRGNSLADSSRREIYDRVGATFTNAIIFKPLDTSPVDALGFAPLIIQEVTAKDVPRRSVDSGAGPSSNQIPSLPGLVTTIYFQRTRTLLHGRPHEQLTYFWRHPDWTPRPVDSDSRIQSVRITLDSAQQPAIWEIARDTSGAEIIFVSHSIERAAVQEYGGPLPGRRFAIERELREAPETIVAGIVEGTPVPMGPMVYIRAATKDLSTIACRCAPAPTDKFIAQGYYALSTDPVPEMNGLLESERPRGKPAGLWRNERPGESRLERYLRLPGSF